MMSWSPFLYDTRNVPGMKYVRFVYDLPTTLSGILMNEIQGKEFSHFDWDELIFYYQGERNEAWGHTITFRGNPELHTILHEKTHVLQSGIFGPLYPVLYYLNEAAAFLYIRSGLSPWSSYVYGSPLTNIFEYWATIAGYGYFPY